MGLGWGGVGMVTFLALAHMVGATQVMGWGGVGVGWGGDGNVPCTCTHGRCYATICIFHLYIYVQSMASFFQRFHIHDS